MCSLYLIREYLRVCFYICASRTDELVCPSCTLIVENHIPWKGKQELPKCKQLTSAESLCVYSTLLQVNGVVGCAYAAKDTQKKSVVSCDKRTIYCR